MTEAAAVRDEIRRAQMLADTGRWSDAEASVRRALAAEPDNSSAICLFAHVRLNVGDPQGALAATDRALASSPNLDWAWRIRSRALGALGDHTGAVASARQAVALQPGLATGHITLAQVLADNVRTRGQATAATQRACELAPDSPEVWVAASYVALRRGRSRLAEDAARRALALDPNNSAALNNLGTALLRRNKFMDAADAYGRAGLSDPSKSEYRRRAGQAISGWAYGRHMTSGTNLVVFLVATRLLGIPYLFVRGLIGDLRLRRLDPLLADAARESGTPLTRVGWLVVDGVIATLLAVVIALAILT